MAWCCCSKQSNPAESVHLVDVTVHGAHNHPARGVEMSCSHLTYAGTNRESILSFNARFHEPLDHSAEQNAVAYVVEQMGFCQLKGG